MSKFFVDNGDGTEYYETAEDARKSAEDWIAEYRTLPEWDEAVERVCWGEVREYARGLQDGDYISYKLAPIIRRRINLPGDEIHDVVHSYGWIVLPWTKGRWLMWSKFKRRFGLTYWQGFHNCSATGVK